MTLSKSPIELALDEMARLLAPGIVGFHTHFEVTEIFSCMRDTNLTTNVLTMLVAEEHDEPPPTKPKFLGDRINLKRFPDRFFGVRQTVLPLSPVFSMLKTIGQGHWHSSSVTIHLGVMASASPQFVYPDSSYATPWNRILKNNFSCGSHVLDLVDKSKSHFEAFFDEPPLLQELSAHINERLPIGLASMSDKLGNIVVQIPVTLLAARFTQLRASGDTAVEIAWHPKATPRPLCATASNDFDKAFDGYASSELSGTDMVLPTHAGPGAMSCTIWDDVNKVLLAAQGRTGLIRQASVNLRALSSSSEPRAFWVVDREGKQVERRVSLVNATTSHVRAPDDKGTEWTHKRIYREENIVASKERLFVQYTPGNKPSEEMHEDALNDLRHLITRHGQKGAWLWDPYLEAPEVLETLFHCPYAGADLRALTEAKEPRHLVRPSFKAVARYYARKLPWATPPLGFVERQRLALQAAQSNLMGLRLEYRMKIGGVGWPFHDRFLIFPGDDGSALAWSLGTSVNSVGRSHHILQRVDDGRRAMDAFLDLWNRLDQPQQLIWKAP